MTIGDLESSLPLNSMAKYANKALLRGKAGMEGNCLKLFEDLYWSF